MSTITDGWGRTITITTEEGQVTYSTEGFTVSFPFGTDIASVLPTFNAMAPEDAIIAPPPTIVESVTLFQCKAQLMRTPAVFGEGTLYDEVNAAVQQLGGESLLAWQCASEVDRTGPLVQALATNFGLSSDALDVLFTAASTISV